MINCASGPLVLHLYILSDKTDFYISIKASMQILYCTLS